MRKLIAFYKEEKKYILLFVLTALIYTLFFDGALGGAKPKQVESGASISTAEQKIDTRLRDEKYWAQMLDERPALVMLAVNGMIFVFAALGYGILLDAAWLISKMRKKPFLMRTAEHPDLVTWPLRDLFKVPVLFMSISLAFALIFHLLHYIFLFDFDSSLFVLFHTAVTDLTVLICVVYFIRSVHSNGIESLGLTFSKWLQDIGLGLAAYCAVLPVFLAVLAALLTVSSRWGYSPPPHPLVEMLVEEKDVSALMITVSLLLACVVGPTVEEVFFRGFCYPILKRHWGMKMAVVLSASIFAVTHHSGFVFLPVFILGAALALLYEWRGTLIPSIALHVAHNALFLGYLFVLKAVFLAE